MKQIIYAVFFTLSDIERIDAESHQSVKPARDADFRLCCGAAIVAHRQADGSLDKHRIVNHVSELVDEGIDAVAVSTAHGFSKSVGDAISLLRSQFKDLTLIAGNVSMLCWRRISRCGRCKYN